MPFRRLRLGLAYFAVFFHRQLKSFSHPLQSNFLKGLILSIGLLLLGAFLVWQLRSQLTHHTLSEGLIGIYKADEYPSLVTNLLSRGLFTVDATNQVIPDLAMSVESNEQGTQFTIKLRDNLFWVDQTPIKSADIQFNFPGAQINYPDDKTIIFSLNEPFTPFPSLLTKPVYRKNSLIGVGPYIVSPPKDLVKGSFLVKKLTLHAPTQNLPDLIIFMYPSESMARQALKMGEIQSILGINDIESYKAENNFQIFSKLNQTQLVAVFYNTKDPILSDENFRLALSFAAPSIANESEAKTTLPSNSWAFNGDIKDYLDNPVQAKNYLKKVEKGKDETISLTTTNYLRSVGEKVVETWKANGINAKVKVESGVPQNFQALLIAQNIPVDPDQYALWHSTQAQTNISKISNPRIDKDLEDGRKATDSAKRKAAYQDFQKVLLDHSPVTPLYFPKVNVVYNKKVELQLMEILKLQLGP